MKFKTIFNRIKIILFIFLVLFHGNWAHTKEISYINQEYMRSLRYFSQSIIKEIFIILSECDIEASSNLYGFHNQKAFNRLDHIYKLFDKVNEAFQNGNPELGITIESDAHWQKSIDLIDQNWKIYRNLIKEIIKEKNLSMNHIDNFININEKIFNIINDSLTKYNIGKKFDIQKMMTISEILSRNFYMINLGKNIEINKEISKQMIINFETMLLNGDSFKQYKDIKDDIIKLNDLWRKIKSCFEISVYADNIDSKNLSKPVDLSLKVLDSLDNLYLKLKIYKE